MVVKVHTQLPTSADHAWRVLSRHDTFPYAARGAFCYTDAERWPEELHEGQEIQTRILFFHWIPAWRHHLRLVRVDDKRREILSQERAGFIGAWNHRIRIKPENREERMISGKSYGRTRGPVRVVRPERGPGYGSGAKGLSTRGSRPH
jgi:hypothetical protein